MGKDPFQLNAGVGRGLFGKVRRLVHLDADAAHPRIDSDMDPGLPARCCRRLVQDFQPPHVEHGLAQPVADDVVRHAGHDGHGAQDQDRFVDARVAQLDAFLRQGDGEKVRPVAHGLDGDRYGTVSVRIRLDDGAELRRRFQEAFRLPHIVRHSVQIDFRPGTAFHFHSW